MNARYAPLSWLNLRATAGLDWVGFKDEALVRNGDAAPNWGYPLGFRPTNGFTTAKYTLDLGATAEFRLATGITSRSSIGAQYNRDLTTGTYATGQGLAPGSRSLHLG